MSRQWESSNLYGARESRQGFRPQVDMNEGYDPYAKQASARVTRPQSRGGTASSTQGMSGRHSVSTRPASREGPLLTSAQSLLRREPSRGYGAATPRTASRLASRDSAGAYDQGGRSSQYEPAGSSYADAGYTGASSAYGGIPVSRPGTQTRTQRTQAAAMPRTVATAATGTRPGSRSSPFAPRTSQAAMRASTARQPSNTRSSVDYGYSGGYDPGMPPARFTASGDYDYADYPDEGADYGNYGGVGQPDYEFSQGGAAYYGAAQDDPYGGAAGGGGSSTAYGTTRTSQGSTRTSHPFAQAQVMAPPATAPARSEAGVMLSDYMARMEIIPRGDARGGGSRGGSRAASRATSAGSDNFVVASNLSDADCMPYDGHDQQVSDSSSDDEADLSAAPRPPTASGSASSAAAAAASSGRPPTATASGGSGGAGFGFDRVASTPERPRPLNGFDLRPATSAVLGGSLSLSGGPLSHADTETTKETDLSALHEDLFSPKDAPAPSGRKGFKVEADWELGATDDVDFGDVPVKQRRATSASVVQARSPWGDLPADRPPSRQKPPPESLDLFAGGTADPRGLVMELRGGRQRPMTAMAAAGMNGGHGGSRGGMMPGGVAQAGGYRPPTNVVSQRPAPAAAAAAAARLALPRSVVHRLADDIYHGSDGEHEEEE